MSNRKTFLNMYWSLRRFLYEQFTGIPIYYNPLMRPSGIGEKFLILHFQEERFGKMSYSFPRIWCVSKTDPELIKLSDLVSAVSEAFASPVTGKKRITLYDEASGSVLGSIEVTDIAVRPVLNYEEGFMYRAVDLTLRYIVEERHL